MTRILFTADLHGNTLQYEKLAAHAQQTRPDAVILGGDLAPKHLPNHYFIWGQRTFLQEKLPDLIAPIPCPVFGTLGNDDARVNEDVFRASSIIDLHARRERLGSYELVGYAHVPVTPFSIKDWERLDLRTPRDDFARYRERIRSNYCMEGERSRRVGDILRFDYHRIPLDSTTIEEELQAERYRRDPQRTVYVMHSPPDTTALDVTGRGEHVGSFAIRRFIEEAQPLLTLHGHIHETVDMTGEYRERIGTTTCIAAGNHNASTKLAVTSIDLARPEEAERLIL